jgi:hypothetical protein
MMTIDLAALRGKVSPFVAKARAVAKEAETTLDVLKDTHTFIQAMKGQYLPSNYRPVDVKKLAEKVSALPMQKHAKRQIERLNFLSLHVCIHEQSPTELHCRHCGAMLTGAQRKFETPSAWKHYVDVLATGLLSERAAKLEKSGILREKAKEAFESLRSLGIFLATVDGMERTLQTDVPDIEDFDRKLRWLEPFRELARC